MSMMTKLWEYLFAPSPVAGKKLSHPQLGTLVADGEGWWVGKYVVEGNIHIKFSIEGTNDAVDQKLGQYCLHILEDFSVYLNLALSLIASDLSIPLNEVRNRFTPTSIFSITKYENESFFYMSVTDAENSLALWRVQFENEIATHAGFDS